MGSRSRPSAFAEKITGGILSEMLARTFSACLSCQKKTDKVKDLSVFFWRRGRDSNSR